MHCLFHPSRNLYTYLTTESRNWVEVTAHHVHFYNLVMCQCCFQYPKVYPRTGTNLMLDIIVNSISHCISAIRYVATWALNRHSITQTIQAILSWVQEQAVTAFAAYEIIFEFKLPLHNVNKNLTIHVSNQLLCCKCMICFSGLALKSSVIISKFLDCKLCTASLGAVHFNRRIKTFGISKQPHSSWLLS